MNFPISMSQMPLFSLDATLTATGVDVAADARQSIALGLVARSNWPLPESSEDWGSRFGRLRAAIECGRFACAFDRVGRLLGGATWMEGPDGSSVRVFDFWASHGSARAVSAGLRSHIGHAPSELVYQRTVRGVARSRRCRLANRTQAAGEARASRNDAQRGFTTRQDLVDDCADMLKQARECGDILCVLAQSSHYAALPTAAVLQLASLWGGLHQYRLYRDASGCPAGLVAWAWLSDRTIADVPRAPLHRLPLSEWNEGTRLCLSDVIVTDATRDAIATDIAGALFPDEAELLTYQYTHGKASVTPWRAADRSRLAQMAAPAPL